MYCSPLVRNVWKHHLQGANEINIIGVARKIKFVCVVKVKVSIHLLQATEYHFKWNYFIKHQSSYKVKAKLNYINLLTWKHFSNTQLSCASAKWKHRVFVYKRKRDRFINYTNIAFSDISYRQAWEYLKSVTGAIVSITNLINWFSGLSKRICNNNIPFYFFPVSMRSFVLTCFFRFTSMAAMVIWELSLIRRHCGIFVYTTL